MIDVIGDGEHKKHLRDILLSSAIYRNLDGVHVGFVGKPGTTHRRKFIESMTSKSVTIIHPSAVVSSGALIGEGCFIGPLAVVNGGAELGRHCVINTGAIVEHDCKLGDGVVMAPRSVLGGAVTVGAWANICLGACVRDHVSIGESAIIGMGAVVVNDIPPNAIAMGVPAKCCS